MQDAGVVKQEGWSGENIYGQYGSREKRGESRRSVAAGTVRKRPVMPDNMEEWVRERQRRHPGVCRKLWVRDGDGDARLREDQQNLPICDVWFEWKGRRERFGFGSGEGKKKRRDGFF